ncbi:MAG TPA: glutathione S-transferase family protein [Roseiarcus sp.]|nr:glutathione S-transferase family protein [Roseiarcus sp.]
MSQIKLHIIKPSVNNMTARVFVRAAKLDFSEDDVYGKTRSPEFMGRNPAHLTPMMEAPGLPKGVMWESCAIMQYLCNKHRLDQFYPAEPEKRAMVDSAMFYVVGTIYPYIVRSTYEALGFPQYAGEVGASDATPAEKENAQKAAAAAVGETLEAFHKFFLQGMKFVGGDHVSIADIRLACSLEFLKAIDYAFPDWTKTYMENVAKALGDAYAEPVKDVEGYIAYVKGKK